MKLLLVDDEKFAIAGLQNMLNWQAFDGEIIGTASNGQEALAFLEIEKPDTIISDIKMPIMDGLQLARIIHDREYDIDIILLTGHGEFEYAKQAIQYGVKDYILKPITREKISQLETFLIQMNQKKETKKMAFLAGWKEDLKEEVLTALRKNDSIFFDNFFPSFLDNTFVTLDTFNARGIQLLSFLYQYLVEINIDKKVLKLSKEHAINEFWDLSNKEEKSNYLITKYYDVLISVNHQKHSSSNTLIAYAIHYIQNHFAAPNFNISYLANEMNVSISYLSTIFKQSMGINISTYLTNLRLEKGKTLLADLKYSITDIATYVGYEDSKYFAKLFKKKIGVTPSEYRNIAVQTNKSL